MFNVLNPISHLHHLRLLVPALVGTALIAGAAAISLANHRLDQVPTGPLPATPVAIAPVEAAPRQRIFATAGMVRAKRQASLGFPGGGRIVDRPVHAGDRVAKGDLLARLDLEPFQLAVEAATARVSELTARQTQATRDRERAEHLAATQVASDEAVELARTGERMVIAALTAAKAEQDEAQRRWQDATLVAPESGIITDVLQQIGEVAAPGAPVVVLAQDGAVEVALELPSAVVEHLEPGNPAELALPLDQDRIVAGRVTRVAKASVGTGRLFTLTIETTGIPPGTPVRVHLTLPNAPALAVPLSAVRDPVGAGAYVVMVDEQSRALRVPVQVVDLQAGLALITTPQLQPGQSVVLGGTATLLDGDPLSVIVSR